MKPITSQPPSLNQFVQPRPNIIAPHTTMPRIGTNGTHGVLNSRLRPGSVLRNTITAAQTSIKANKVPMLVISPTMSPGTNAANKPTKIRNIQLALYGVLNFGWTVEKTGGTNPSRLME